MREIKFRAWHTKLKKMISCEEMVRDQLTLLPDGRFINVSGIDTRLSIIYPQDKFIPLQYTGFRDKNGTEIFEDDIVKQCNLIFIVKWVEGGFWLIAKDKYGSRINQKIDFAKVNDVETEIIGNNYENKELLK